MTVKVAGLWERGWNTPIKEVELWEFPLRDFAVNEHIMVPVSGIENSYVTEVPNLGDWLVTQRALGLTIVFLDENGQTPLQNFVHPPDAVYVCGKANLSSLVAYSLPGDLSLKILTPANLGGFWPHQAVSIVLYDRFLKSSP